MGYVDSSDPKYIGSEELTILQNVVKAQNRQQLNEWSIYLRAQYGIDWSRKSLDLKTGQIICEWFNDRNIDRDYRE